MFQWLQGDCLATMPCAMSRGLIALGLLYRWVFWNVGFHLGRKKPQILLRTAMIVSNFVLMTSHLVVVLQLCMFTLTAASAASVFTIVVCVLFQMRSNTAEALQAAEREAYPESKGD